MSKSAADHPGQCLGSAVVTDDKVDRQSSSSPNSPASRIHIPGYYWYGRKILVDKRD